MTERNEDEHRVRKERPELVFADLTKGRAFRPLTYPVTRDLVARFMEVTGDRQALYWNEAVAAAGPFGRPIAPPGLAAIYSRLSYLQGHSMPSGGILAKQEFEFISPMQVGETLQVRAVVMDSYVDERGRKRVNFLIEARNAEGQAVSVTRLYAIWPK